VIPLLALGAFVSGISLRCVEPMLPQLAADFSTTVSTASVIVAAFAVAYACTVLLQGGYSSAILSAAAGLHT
jgi:predicted MFS family arabinose efflux permease